MDTDKKIDEKLNLGTGDDELVDNIVKTAKTSMGLAGSFVPDQVVTSQLKNRSTAKK